MKTIAITIEDDILHRIETFTRKGEYATNRSQFILEAVRDYLTRLERLAEEGRERELIHRHRHRLHREALALIKEQAKS
jgi:metal-responsive CopG/Arc/MetJ family transcriptional regulator